MVMRLLKKPVALCCAIVLTATIAPAAFADDGYLVRKSMSHEGSEKLPPGQTNKFPVENEHAFIQMMKFYVPIQQANGTVLDEGVDYLNIDEEVVDTRTLAKPLVGVYINGQVEGVDGVGFVGHGKRDAWGAISLDDGETWKNTNLSESADLSSSDVERRDIKLFKDTKYEYPGDVVNIFHAVAGPNVLVAWPSRFCEQGQPSYSLSTENADPEQLDRRDAIAEYLGIDLETASPDDLYLIDMYGVAGSQGSVDYTEDKFEQNAVVGEVPFNCLWTARGQLIQGDDPRTDEVEASFMRWFKAERLTSGRRDVNRIETQCVEGAGCAITWQEDPDGLRPGQGEGPGEGWSGAIANRQTDIWYSYIDWENFNVVQDPTAEDPGLAPMDLADYEALFTDSAADAADETQKPKPFVPFAMPMRMTDNAKCNVEKPEPYCYGSALVGLVTEEYVPVFPSDAATTPMDYGLKDQCYDTVTLLTGNQNPSESTICVTQDGLPLIGNTAATRPRLNLFGYASTDKKDDPVDSAFTVVIAEEDKGLGSFGFEVTETTDDGVPISYNPDAPCDPEADDNCFAFDEGKNIWYHSFGMSFTDSDAILNDEKDGLLANLTFHGNMLNQPEVSWGTGEFYPVVNTANMWGVDDGFGLDPYDFYLYNTEIARRGSLLAQGIDQVGKAGLFALPTWKQGAMNQGGPADVMSRRIVVKNWKLTDGNPYAFRNMECEDLAYDDGSNPYYPEGVCLDSAINMSSTIPDTCTDSDTGESIDCPTVDLTQGTYGIGDTNPILQGVVQGEGNTTKVLSWHQCPADFTTVSQSDGTTVVTCEEDARTDNSTLADQSWYNPLEVAKGHRGYLDGDFVMTLYAWSPNWRLNAKGNDRYELYIRRSFDGAETWTTLPKGFDASDDVKYDGDGTVTCETWRALETGLGSETEEPQVCNAYDAGAPEQARNVTQLASMRTTTLDPRYAPTSKTITSELFGYVPPNYGSVYGAAEDVRDPSRYFIVYETGDNTTTAEGEPEPLDLFYSRAVNFGDDYQVWFEDDYTTTESDGCYPSDPHDDDKVSDVVIESGFCNEFDQLEQGIPGLEASEASLTANPGGEFLYGAWAQALHEIKNKNKTTVESDAMARRVWWIDGYISDTYAWDFGQGTGDGTPAT
jgi:hypothetical protein